MAVEAAVFTIWDYVVFVGFLLISTLIGLYFACSGNKQGTNRELLLADRKMSPLPVALSLVASFISAISITGTPSEWYYRGIQYVFAYLGALVCLVLSAHVYLPILYNTEYLSIHQYLELRFRHKIPRYLGSALFSLQVLMYMSIVLYTPALAINVVTTFPIWACILIVGGVCTFYTAIGGLKAVIWTDVFQSLVMYGAMLTIIIWGSMQVGGLQRVWELAVERGRILDSFDYSWDPMSFQTVGYLFFNGIFYWLGAYACSQQAVQRYLSMPTLRDAQISLYLNIPGLFIIVFLCGFSGIVIFANYVDCDPLTNGDIIKKDQIVPYYIIDKIGQFPGVAGLFIATLFSGSLSTISSGVNSMSAIMWDDYLKFCFREPSERFAANVTKALAVLFGVVSIGCAFLVANLKGILQTTVTILGAIGGPLTGIFTLAVLFPSANWVGATVGTLLSLATVGWMAVGQMLNRDLVYAEFLPLSTEGCAAQAGGNTSGVVSTAAATTLTATTSTVASLTAGTGTTAELTGIERLYKVTYLMYPIIGCLGTVLLGLIISGIAECIVGYDKLPWADSKYCHTYTSSKCCHSKRKSTRITGKSNEQLSYNEHDDYPNDKYLYHSNPTFYYDGSVSAGPGMDGRGKDNSWVLGTSV